MNKLIEYFSFGIFVTSLFILIVVVMYLISGAFFWLFALNKISLLLTILVLSITIGLSAYLYDKKRGNIYGQD